MYFCAAVHLNIKYAETNISCSVLLCGRLLIMKETIVRPHYYSDRRFMWQYKLVSEESENTAEQLKLTDS